MRWCTKRVAGPNACSRSSVRDSFEITSILEADAESVWQHCSSMKGVSRELWPLLRMTYPESKSSLIEEPFVAGKPLFRSTLLLFGVLPIDRTELTLIELEPGRRFLERSPMKTQRVWEHERSVEPVEEGTRVTDRLQWRGRYPGTGVVFAMVVPLLFEWRHHRLERIFGKGSTKTA